MDALNKLIETLDGYLAFAKTTAGKVSVEYQMRLLSPANPLLVELAEWVHTQVDDGSEIGCDFEDQESEFSRAVWILKNTLFSVTIEYAPGKFIVGWGNVATVISSTCSDVRFIEMLSSRLKAAQRCLPQDPSDSDRVDDLDEYSEEDRRSGDWCKIFALSNTPLSSDTWRARVKGKKGDRIRVKYTRSPGIQWCRVRTADMPEGMRSKRSRDKLIKDWNVNPKK